MKSYVNALIKCLNRRCVSEEEGAWRVEQLNFTTEVRGSINESAFSKSLVILLVLSNNVKAIRERQAWKAL